MFTQKDLRSQPTAGAPSQRNAAAAATLNQGTTSISNFENLNESGNCVCGWCTLGDIRFLPCINTKMLIARRVVFVYEMQLWSNNPTAATLAATSVSNAARCCFDQLCLSRTMVEMICHRYMAHIIDAIHINVTFFQNYGRRCEGPCWQRLGNCSCAVEQGNSLRQTAKPWMVPEQVGLLQYGLPLLSA